jgi:hypothetical protein
LKILYFSTICLLIYYSLSIFGSFPISYAEGEVMEFLERYELEIVANQRLKDQAYMDLLKTINQNEVHNLTNFKVINEEFSSYSFSEEYELDPQSVNISFVCHDVSISESSTENDNYDYIAYLLNNLSDVNS